MIHKRFLKFCSIAFSAMLMVAFSGCVREKVPPMVMDTATLKDFLVEAYLVEGFAYAVDESKRDSAALMVAAAYDSLYSKYGTTADAVDSTLDYYTRHPQQLEEVYSRVTSRLRDLNDSIHKAVFVSEE